MPSKRESSARVDYVPALCTHRPSLLPIEWSGEILGAVASTQSGQPGCEVSPFGGEVDWTLPFRGRRSRNKVSVGEPAEGSLIVIYNQSKIMKFDLKKTNLTKQMMLKYWLNNKYLIENITFNNGYLGSFIDEERS